MTKVNTAASVPPILHISTARVLQTAAGDGRLEKLGDAFFHPLIAPSQSILLQLREGWKEEEDACQQYLAIPSLVGL